MQSVDLYVILWGTMMSGILSFSIKPNDIRVQLVEDIAGDMLKKIETTLLSTTTEEQFRCRPGFAFGLGCDEWEASAYRGTVEGWTARPRLSWLSKSLMRSMDENTILQNRLDIMGTVGALVDVPHFRLDLSLSKEGYNLNLDYIPRQELISSLDYYDRYFKGVEEAQYQAISKARDEKKLTLKGMPESALTRMVMSPFAIRATIDSDAGDVVRSFCEQHVDRWCSWMTTAKPTDDISVNTIRYNRDIGLQKLLYEDHKFSLALIMGSNFAPKAEELAASMIGPPLGNESYADFLTI